MISLNILENVSSMVYKKDLLSILSKIYESICISDNLESTYAVFHHRAEMNSLACSGEYSSSLEI